MRLTASGGSHQSSRYLLMDLHCNSITASSGSERSNAALQALSGVSYTLSGTGQHLWNAFFFYMVDAYPECL